jgi:UDPglucose--hexose-1-phosphate uridylyltransferase
LTGEEVVIATERVVERRPALIADTAPADCPFCPGHEADTTATIDTVNRGGTWVARAFPNRRPVLVVEEPLRASADGPFERVSGVGAHEVLVECPEHAPLHHLPLSRTADALELARRRLTDLRGDRRLRLLQWFRNHGVGAGASLHHPHAQIVGLPVVPRRAAELAHRAREHHARTGRSLLRDVLQAEERDGRRILWREGPITALCPFAPRHPFEVWLVPADPGPGLADARDDELAGLAAGLVRVARAWAAALGEVAYTAVALGAPEGQDPSGLGWHVRLAPRLVVAAGLEEATGLTVHAVPPEEAARVLRSVPLPVP